MSACPRVLLCCCSHFAFRAVVLWSDRANPAVFCMHCCVVSCASRAHTPWWAYKHTRAWAAAAAAEPRHGPHSRSRTPQAAAAGRKRSASAAAASGGDYGDDDDGDDLWADRLWQDMQQHQRQAAAARAAAAAAAAAGVSSSSRLFGAGPSRQEAAQERERKAAAAAAESARILREERAKDADWRAAMMRQVEEVRAAERGARVVSNEKRGVCVVSVACSNSRQGLTTRHVHGLYCVSVSSAWNHFAAAAVCVKLPFLFGAAGIPPSAPLNL